jgi:hypothetical protein
MSFLKQLSQQKKAREQEEKDLEKFKNLYLKMLPLVTEYDGEFLNDLENLLTKWKNKET